MGECFRVLQTLLVILSDRRFSGAFGLFFNLVSTVRKYTMAPSQIKHRCTALFCNMSCNGTTDTWKVFGESSFNRPQAGTIYSTKSHTHINWNLIYFSAVLAKQTFLTRRGFAGHWQYDSNNFWLLDSVQARCRRAWLNERNYAGVGNLSSLPQASLTWPWLHNYYVYLILTLSAPPECPIVCGAK